MRFFISICASIILLHCYLSGIHDNIKRGRHRFTHSGNVLGVGAWPVANFEVISRNINEIPQWHCLRYFKHDVHLMRRCRNQRLSIMRRIIND